MRKLLIAAGVNLVLGVPGIVPIFLGWYFLVNGPLSDLGWTVREPTEDDGTLVLGVFLAPVLLISAAIYGWANWWLRRRTDVSALPYWTACVTAFFLPVLVVFGVF